MALHGGQQQGMAMLQQLLQSRMGQQGAAPGNVPQIRGGIPGRRGGLGAMLQQMMAMRQGGMGRQQVGMRGQRQPGNAGAGGLQQMMAMLGGMGGMGGQQGAPGGLQPNPGNMRSQLRRQMLLRGNQRRAVLGV